MSDQMVPRLRDARQLRLAVVCYGGVSLAIYMHGITKELQKLIVASVGLEESPDDNPFDVGCSEHVYWNLLRELRDAHDQVPTRVVVDIISGTSAGGINGVCLAKALATNRQQDPLRDVWLDRGDISTLLHGPRQLPVWMRFPMLSVTSLFGWPRSFLRGEQMCQWLFEAMEAIDASPAAIPDRDSLLSLDDPSLQLFVPVTDFYGYVRMIPLDDPKRIHDRTHRHVVPFDFAVLGRDGFTGTANHALAFTARATSSFPGAFAAISVNDYANVVDGGEELRSALDRLFATYDDMGADPERSWFVDGGVLDNLPFGSAIAAIDRRPASTEVDRRLLFIDPTPDPEPVDDAAPPAAPGWLSTAVQSIASIPRAEPIIDDLLSLAQRNETVARIREIIETAFQTVTDHVMTTVSQTLGWPDPKSWPSAPDLDEIRRWRRTLEDVAQTSVGPSYYTYIRLRLANVLDGYANQIADVAGLNARQRAFVRSVLRRHAERRGLVTASRDAVEQQQQFLRELDLSYHERGLRLLVDGLSWWYRDQDKEGVPTRDALDRLKRAVYEQIATLRRVGTDLRSDLDLVTNVRTVFDATTIDGLIDRAEQSKGRSQPAEPAASAATPPDAIDEFLASRADTLDRLQDQLRSHLADVVSEVERDLYDELAADVDHWPTGSRQDLLVRYLGLPFWDALIYPIQALSGVGERDHVEVSRISPIDARLLSHKVPREPLAGVALHSFGAFFDRNDREHDYLWGRLDAAERLITLLFDDPYEPGLRPPDPQRCVAAFEAIVAEERNQLRNTKALSDVDRRIAQIGRDPVGVAPPVVEATDPMH